MERSINDPVWSVIILLSLGLIFTLYVIVYILKMSNDEQR
jgi:uncharacterized protein YpmS